MMLEGYVGVVDAQPELLEALRSLIGLLDEAGLSNLSTGVQPTRYGVNIKGAWLAKMQVARERSLAIIAKVEGGVNR